MLLSRLAVLESGLGLEFLLDLDLDFDLGSKDSDLDLDLKAINLDLDLDLEALPASPFSSPCLLYTSPSPRDRQKSRMPSSA